MKKSEEITELAYEILIDLSEDKIPLHCILLKASRLAMITNDPANMSIFQRMSNQAETSAFLIETFQSSIDAARDPNTSLASANPNQYLYSSGGNNSGERTLLRKNTMQSISQIAEYRSSTYSFSLNIYQKYRLGNTAETIFERKRGRTDPILVEIFPDINERLNSIDLNIKSKNKEDWKNAVTSCRTLLMDIADILNPPETKGNYINQLKDFVSKKEESETRQKLLGSYINELKERIKYTVDLTQGPSHQTRPTLRYAEDVVLMTYLLISDLLDIYISNKETSAQEEQT